jgi:hypothetical protein
VWAAVDQVLPLEQVAEAHRHSETDLVKGKIVLAVTRTVDALTSV